MAASNTPARQPDRAATEQLLETAALELLDEKGVLAGLNLREAADRVGVNRGLVYHYFGTRRALLRSAMRRRGELIGPALRERQELPFVDRMIENFRATLSPAGADFVKLVTLLVLDGDPEIRTLPLARWSLRLLDADRERGDLAAEVDIEALLALLSAAGAGYALLHKRYAAELGVSVDALDERVEAVLSQLVGRLVTDQAG